MLGHRRVRGEVAGLSRLNLVQQGAELAVSAPHDPEFRRVRREDSSRSGRRIRLKREHRAAASVPRARASTATASSSTSSRRRPRKWCIRRWTGIVPPERIIADAVRLRRRRRARSQSIARVPAGYGKVAAVDELRDRLGIPRDRIVYVGDGSSDIHVMLHVNRCDGFTIAASEARYIARDRAAHRDERRRAERAGPRPRGHRRLQAATRSARSSRPRGADPGVGQACAPTG